MHTILGIHDKFWCSYIFGIDFRGKVKGSGMFLEYSEVSLLLFCKHQCIENVCLEKLKKNDSECINQKMGF